MSEQDWFVRYATSGDISELRRTLSRRFSKDMDQDQRIAALQRENLSLAFYLRGLLNLLITKGLITEQEAIHVAERAEASMPPEEQFARDDTPAGQTPVSPELIDLSRAAQEVARRAR